MQSHVGTLGVGGEVVIPLDIRERLGLEVHDPVLFVVRDDGTVELRPQPMPLEDVFGSVPSLSHETDDLKAEIALAMEEHAIEKYRRLAE